MFKAVLIILAIHINIVFMYRVFLSEESKNHIRDFFKAHPYIVGTSDACIIAALIYSFAFNL